MMMIRNDRQLSSLEEMLRTCLEEIEQLREIPDSDNDHSESLLMAALEQAMLIAADIREYKALKGVGFKVPIIPTNQIETGLPGFAGGLFSARKSAGLSQAELSERMSTSQSHIARMENNNTENYEVESVRRWAERCGFDFTGLFVRPAEYDDPSAIVRLVLEAVLIRSSYGRTEDAAAAMEIFLKRLASVTEADIVTCYLLHPVENRMQLFFTHGLRDVTTMRGRVKSSNVPLRILRRPLGFIPDVKTDTATCNSSFAAREGVAALFHIPFDVNGHLGIIFLNYRRPVTHPSSAYLKSLGELSTALSVIFPHGIDPLFSKNSAQQYSARSPESTSFSPEKTPELLKLFQKFAVDGITNKNFRIAIAIARKYLSANGEIKAALYLEENHRLKREFVERGDDEFPVEIEGKDPSIIREAAGRNTYVLSSDKQIYAVPLTVNATPPLRCVLTMKTESNCEFSIEDAQIIEWIGQCIAAAHAFYEIKSKKDNTQDRIRERVIELFASLNPDHGKTISNRLQSLAELAIELFDAAIVDIWPFDWFKKAFSEAGAQAASSKFDQRLEGDKLRPRERGNSMEIVSPKAPNSLEDTQDFCKMRDVCFIDDALNDPSVSPYTVTLGVKSLIGVPIYGPESARAEGVLWIRFDNVIPPEHREQLSDDVLTFAQFIHLVWEPTSTTSEDPTAQSTGM